MRGALAAPTYLNEKLGSHFLDFARHKELVVVVAVPHADLAQRFLDGVFLRLRSVWR